MKYRIKIVTYRTGRKEYFAQKKTWFSWIGISYDGEANSAYNYSSSESKDKALERIDLNYKGNTKPQTIEIEYINKNNNE